MKDIKGCFVGLLELAGLFIALTWPILLLFLWSADRAAK